MKVQLNTDKHIQGDESLAQHVEQVVGEALARFGDRVARVEVHLSDANGGKGGSNDKRCMMEARLEGLQPAAATADAPNVRAAINGAAKKLQRVLDSSLGKLAH